MKVYQVRADCVGGESGEGSVGIYESPWYLSRSAAEAFKSAIEERRDSCSDTGYKWTDGEDEDCRQPELVIVEREVYDRFCSEDIQEQIKHYWEVHEGI